MRFIVKIICTFVALPLVVAILYLGVALLTARIEGAAVDVDRSDKPHTIHLVTTLLHADIAVPVTPQIRDDFPMLRQSRLPFDNPGMKFVLFGWGSKAFYTTAGSYSDIELGAVFTAITGDQSVMRVSAAGNIRKGDDVIELKVSTAQLAALYKAMKQGFVLRDGKAVPIDGASLSAYDTFFEGNGDFNILHPCNQWVNGVLRQAGVHLGIWTPTTQSLAHSLAHFEQD